MPLKEDIPGSFVEKIERYWMSSSELRRSATGASNDRTGCQTCCMLSDAADTLIAKSGMADADSVLKNKFERFIYKIGVEEQEIKLWRAEENKCRPVARSLCLVLCCLLKNELINRKSLISGRDYWENRLEQSNVFPFEDHWSEYPMELYAPPGGK